MNTLWNLIDLRAIYLVRQIAFRNGLKEGDKLTDKEFREAHLRHPDWIKVFGNTELTKEELIKEYVSHGKSVLDFNNKNCKIYKPLDS
jgi:hypothetical protein